MEDNGKTHEKDFTLVVVRLTIEQREAVDKAIQKYRDMGSRVRISTMARSGMSAMCEAIGVPFPNTEGESPSPAGESPE